MDTTRSLLVEVVTDGPLGTRRRRRGKGRGRRRYQVQKPTGTLHPRVQAVGPEHFGVVCVDCAKARSKWMLADFYGQTSIPPTVVEHTRTDFEAALMRLRRAVADHRLTDLIIAVERTGRYHLPARRAFAAAGFEVRVVHPFATKQFRQPADPGNKTDDTDLAALHRAAVNGFGLAERDLDPVHEQLQILARHRRDLVRKSVVLRCQIQGLLEALMPGYANCFDDVFGSNIALPIARHTGSAAAVRRGGGRRAGPVPPRGRGADQGAQPSHGSRPGPRRPPTGRRTPRHCAASWTPWRTTAGQGARRSRRWSATWPRCWCRRPTCCC